MSFLPGFLAGGFAAVVLALDLLASLEDLHEYANTASTTNSMRIVICFKIVGFLKNSHENTHKTAHLLEGSGFLAFI